MQPLNPVHKAGEDSWLTRAPSPAMEHHYTVAEIAAMWNLSKDAIRRMFQNEPGVLILGDRSSRRKRRYTTLRIPQSVLERVHQRCSLYR
jgi:hypothetical protein